MTEHINMTWKEICHEVTLRQKGKKGEWELISDLDLARLYMARKMRMPVVLTREYKNAQGS